MQGTIEHNSLGDIIFIHDWTDNVEEAVRSVLCIVRPDPTGSPWGRDIIEAMSMVALSSQQAKKKFSSNREKRAGWYAPAISLTSPQP